jgi:hypothetical protein
VRVQAVEDGDVREFCARTRALMPADDLFVAAGAATWGVTSLGAGLESHDGGHPGRWVGDGLPLGTVAAARYFGLTTVVVTPDTESVDPALTAVLAGENLPGLAPSTRPVWLESVQMPRVSAEEVYTAAQGLRRGVPTRSVRESAPREQPRWRR